MAYALLVFQTTWLVMAAVLIAAIVMYLIVLGVVTIYVNIW